MRNNKKHIYEDVKLYVESFGYKLLSTQYFQCDRKLSYMCPEGHIYDTTYSIFRSGSRCPICAKKNKKTPTKFSYDYVKDYFNKQGYKLISETYKSVNCKLDVLCPDVHNEFHKLYGKCDFTIDNFKEFYFNKTGKDFNKL